MGDRSVARHSDPSLDLPVHAVLRESASETGCLGAMDFQGLFRARLLQQLRQRGGVETQQVSSYFSIHFVQDIL